MKRRDFLAQSAAGILLPVLGRAQTTKPCPPSSLSVDGGTPVTTNCANPGNAEADWQTRIASPGVVWYHDFRSAAEVNNFRWSSGYGSGNDPNDVARPGEVGYEAGGGITGGALKLTHPNLSGSDSTHWIRPFAPLDAASTGRGAADPAAGGALTLRHLVASDAGGQHAGFAFGWYGHSSYVAADPTHFDGTEFWLQYRAKRDPGRVSGGNENILVGKHIYLAATEGSVGAMAQELVVYSNGGNTSGGSAAGQNSLRIYGGESYFNPLDGGIHGDGTIQPGGVAPIWQWANGAWDTVMYHLVMGRKGVDETLIEVFGAHANQTTFTKFWSQTFPYQDFEVRNGLQTLQCSIYNNSNASVKQYVDRWCQMIFASGATPIPCPQV
jgi:hypothetical protein